MKLSKCLKQFKNCISSILFTQMLISHGECTKHMSNVVQLHKNLYTHTNKNIKNNFPIADTEYIICFIRSYSSGCSNFYIIFPFLFITYNLFGPFLLKHVSWISCVKTNTYLGKFCSISSVDRTDLLFHPWWRKLQKMIMKYKEYFRTYKTETQIFLMKFRTASQVSFLISKKWKI